MRLLLMLPIVLGLAGVPSASGAVLYSFVFGSPTYSGAPGAKVTVDVFFNETAMAGETLQFFENVDGFTSYNVDVSYLPDASPTSVISIDAGDVTINPVFNIAQFVDIDNIASTVTIGGFVDPGIKIADATATQHQVLLGSIDFTVDGAIGQTATIQLDPGAFGGAFFDDPGTAMSPVAYGTATFSVIAVPEPSVFVAIAIATSGALVLRRRRARLASKQV